MITRFSIFLSFLMLIGCSANDDSPQNENSEQESVSIVEIINISSNSVTIEAVVQGNEITDKGLVWGTTSNPTLENSESKSDGSGAGNFTATITGLQSKTGYFVRVYAISNGITLYSEEYSFTSSTLCDSNIYDGYVLLLSLIHI